MLFCKGCGAQMGEGDNFCEKCGTPAEKKMVKTPKLSKMEKTASGEQKVGFDIKKLLSNKKARIIVIAAAVLVLAILAVVIICVNHKSYRTVIANSVHGDVLLTRKKAEPIYVEKDMRFIPNDHVEVGGKGSNLDLLVDNDKHILVEQNSIFDIEATGNPEKGMVRVRLVEGSAVFEIENKLSEKDSFNVETSNATISVRGTKFSVEYDAVNHITYVKVIEGTVWVVAGDEELVLNAGEMAIIYDDHVDVCVSDETYEALKEKMDAIGDLYAENKGNTETAESVYEVYYAGDAGRINEISAALSMNEEAYQFVQDFYDLEKNAITEDEAQQMMADADAYLSAMESNMLIIQTVAADYAVVNQWREVYKNFVAQTDPNGSWMIMNLYGSEIPELMYYSYNGNVGNGRYGTLIFYAYDGAGGVKQIGSQGWEINEDVGVLDGQAVSRTFYNGDGTWDVRILNVSDNGVSTGRKIGHGSYTNMDDWVSRCGGTTGEWADWYSTANNRSIIRAIETY